MELPAAGDGVNLVEYRPRPPPSLTHGTVPPGGFTGSDEPADGSGGAGLETLDAPPTYDFYANTMVCGRQRRFRPSLYQLYADPEVRNPQIVVQMFVCTI